MEVDQAGPVAQSAFAALLLACKLLVWLWMRRSIASAVRCPSEPRPSAEACESIAALVGGTVPLVAQTLALRAARDGEAARETARRAAGAALAWFIGEPAAARIDGAELRARQAADALRDHAHRAQWPAPYRDEAVFAIFEFVQSLKTAAGGRQHAADGPGQQAEPLAEPVLLEQAGARLRYGVRTLMQAAAFLRTGQIDMISRARVRSHGVELDADALVAALGELCGPPAAARIRGEPAVLDRSEWGPIAS